MFNIGLERAQEYIGSFLVITYILCTTAVEGSFFSGLPNMVPRSAAVPGNLLVLGPNPKPPESETLMLVGAQPAVFEPTFLMILMHIQGGEPLCECF